MLIHAAQDTDYRDILALAEREPGIVRHTTYTYWLVQELDPEGVLVCRDGETLAGFIAGIYNCRNQTETMLIQIAVSEHYKKQRVGTQLVQQFMHNCRTRGTTAILFTISPSNTTSKSFATSLAHEARSSIISLGTTGHLGGTMDEEDIWYFSLK